MTSWDGDEEIEVLEGTDLTLTCTVNSLGFLKIARITRQSSTDSSSEVFFVSENQNLKDPFDTTSRYSLIKAKNEDGSVRLELTITGLSILSPTGSKISCS